MVPITFAANNTQILRVICRKVVYVSKLPDYLILDLGNVQNIAEVIENGRTVRKVCLFKWPIISSQELRNRYSGQ